MSKDHSKGKGKKRHGVEVLDKGEESSLTSSSSSSTATGSQQDIVFLCVDCEFRPVKKETHKKNHWIISLQDLFKEINPLLQNHDYLYTMRPYRSKIEELIGMISSTITNLSNLSKKLALSSTPQQQLIESVAAYSQNSSSTNFATLIESIQKNLRVSSKDTFFELIDTSADGVSSFAEAEQVVLDYSKILKESNEIISSFSLHVAQKDRPVDYLVSEENVQDLYKQIEGATSIKIREAWCSDDFDPLCKQLALSLQNNQTAKEVDINLSKLTLSDIGAELITKSLSFIKPVSSLNLNFSGCEISGKGFSKLISSMPHLNKLSLNISENTLKLDAIKALSKSIASTRILDTLSLNMKNCHLGPEGVRQILLGIAMNQSILNLKIQLENNQIGMKGVQNFIESIAKNKTAKKIEINLQYNSITNECVTQLNEGWIHISEAREIKLNLSKNTINGAGAESLFEAIKMNEYTKIFTVFLNANKISDDESKSILVRAEEYLEAKKKKTSADKFQEAIVFSF